jgi:asparagine synthetase B (glutamine-hydrolysing)
MCGIAGVIASDGKPPPSPNCEHLLHNSSVPAPMRQAAQFKVRSSLGHSQLSIVHPAGRQPMEYVNHGVTSSAYLPRPSRW